MNGASMDGGLVLDADPQEIIIIDGPGGIIRIKCFSKHGRRKIKIAAPQVFDIRREADPDAA